MVTSMPAVRPSDVRGDAFDGRGDFVAGNARVGDERVFAEEGAEVRAAEADPADASMDRRGVGLPRWALNFDDRASPGRSMTRALISFRAALEAAWLGLGASRVGEPGQADSGCCVRLGAGMCAGLVDGRLPPLLLHVGARLEFAVERLTTWRSKLFWVVPCGMKSLASFTLRKEAWTISLGERWYVSQACPPLPSRPKASPRR